MLIFQSSLSNPKYFPLADDRRPTPAVARPVTVTAPGPLSHGATSPCTNKGEACHHRAPVSVDEDRLHPPAGLRHAGGGPDSDAAG